MPRSHFHTNAGSSGSGSPFRIRWVLILFLATGSILNVVAQNPVYQIHVVRVGESLSDIAEKHQIDVDRICWLNSISCDDTTSSLTAGTVLRIRLEVVETDEPDEVLENLPEPETAPQIVRPPLADIVDEYVEVGVVRVYDRMLAGRGTMSGETYEPKLPTVSHRSLPFDTVVILYNPKTGRSAFARVNDRGPLDEQFMLDVSERIAVMLGLNEYDPADIEMRIVNRIEKPRN